MLLNFEILPSKLSSYDKIRGLREETPYHSKGWFFYLVKLYPSYKPLFVKIRDEEKEIGFFSGFLLGRCVYSPMVGTGTYTQGLSLTSYYSICERMHIYDELVKFLYSKKIWYIRVIDYNLRIECSHYIPEDKVCFPYLSGYNYSAKLTYTIDLNKTESELWKNLQYKSCKYAINKASKNGLTVKLITSSDDIEWFIKIHRQHIESVRSRKKDKSKREYQDEYRLKNVCENLYPSNVLMLYVEYPDGNGQPLVIASSIWLVGTEESFFYTGASLEGYMHLCPNELMIWEAMRNLKKRGSLSLNMGGLFTYKKKYGSVISAIPIINFKKNSWIVTKDDFYKTIYNVIRKVKHKLC